MMKELNTLPFYLTYPSHIFEQSCAYKKDLEYFRQMFPMSVKKLVKQIADRIHLIDYEGSFVYDEYPDELMLRKMTQDFVDDLKKKADSESPDYQKLIRSEWIYDYVFLLMVSEIMKCRQENSDEDLTIAFYHG